MKVKQFTLTFHSSQELAQIKCSSTANTELITHQQITLLLCNCLAEKNLSLKKRMRSMQEILKVSQR